MHGTGIVGGSFTPRWPLDYQFATHRFSELWFDSEDDLVAAFASPEGKTLLADLPNFTGQIDPIISVETQILWP